MENQAKLEIVKFLKTPAYQVVIQKINNSFNKDKAYFEGMYEGEDEYKPGELTHSEISLNIEKLNFFKSRLDEIAGDSLGAESFRELLLGNIEGIRSQIYNTATNGFGMSKDVPTFTSDDVRKYIMLHKKDFHILVVGLMMPSQDGQSASLQEKYDIYDKPEEFF